MSALVLEQQQQQQQHPVFVSGTESSSPSNSNKAASTFSSGSKVSAKGTKVAMEDETQSSPASSSSRRLAQEQLQHNTSGAAANDTDTVPAVSTTASTSPVTSSASPAPSSPFATRHHDHHHRQLANASSANSNDDDAASTVSSASGHSSASSSSPSSSSSSSEHVEESKEKAGRWTKLEHARFLEALDLYGRDWRRISAFVGTRSNIQSRTHAQKHFKKIDQAALRAQGKRRKSTVGGSGAAATMVPSIARLTTPPMTAMMVPQNPSSAIRSPVDLKSLRPLFEQPLPLYPQQQQQQQHRATPPLPYMQQQPPQQQQPQQQQQPTPMMMMANPFAQQHATGGFIMRPGAPGQPAFLSMIPPVPTSSVPGNQQFAPMHMYAAPRPQFMLAPQIPPFLFRAGAMFVPGPAGTPPPLPAQAQAQAQPQPTPQAAQPAVNIERIFGPTGPHNPSQ